MNDDYHLVLESPTPETYVSLRDAAEVPLRPLAAAERGVPNTVLGVCVVFEGVTGDEVIDIGRLVGDGGAVFQVVDVAVHPDHQGRGLGTRVMDAFVDYLDREASLPAFVNLLADVDGYYERWGFEPTAPVSKGMFLRVGEGGVRGRDENRGPSGV